MSIAKLLAVKTQAKKKWVRFVKCSMGLIPVTALLFSVGKTNFLRSS
jgi:hypothetical protein